MKRNNKEKVLDEFLSKFPEEALEVVLQRSKIQKKYNAETDPAKKAELNKLLHEYQKEFIDIIMSKSDGVN